jgi:hypothetical protein
MEVKKKIEKVIYNELFNINQNARRVKCLRKKNLKSSR